MSGSKGGDGGPERGGADPEGPGFVVIDKRGQEREPSDRGEGQEPDDPGQGQEPSAGEAPPPAEEPAPGGALPQVDFATLVISLGTSAMMHLGLVADPETGQPAPRNPTLARQTIDTLAMLQEKTRGNLEADEE